METEVDNNPENWEDIRLFNAIALMVQHATSSLNDCPESQAERDAKSFLSIFASQLYQEGKDKGYILTAEQLALLKDKK